MSDAISQDLGVFKAHGFNWKLMRDRASGFLVACCPHICMVAQGEDFGALRREIDGLMRDLTDYLKEEGMTLTGYVTAINNGTIGTEVSA